MKILSNFKSYTLHNIMHTSSSINMKALVNSWALNINMQTAAHKSKQSCVTYKAYYGVRQFIIIIYIYMMKHIWLTV